MSRFHRRSLGVDVDVIVGVGVVVVFIVGVGVGIIVIVGVIAGIGVGVGGIGSKKIVTRIFFGTDVRSSEKISSVGEFSELSFEFSTNPLSVEWQRALVTT